MCPAISVKLRITAHPAIGAILANQHGDRTVTLGLYENPTVKFQRRANHCSQRYGFAQDAGKMRRIVVAVQDR